MSSPKLHSAPLNTNNKSTLFWGSVLLRVVTWTQNLSTFICPHLLERERTCSALTASQQLHPVDGGGRRATTVAAGDPSQQHEASQPSCCAYGVVFDLMKRSLSRPDERRAALKNTWTRRAVSWLFFMLRISWTWRKGKPASYGGCWRPTDSTPVL